MAEAYRAAYLKSLEDLRAVDPAGVCLRAGAEPIPGGYRVVFMGQPVEVDLPGGRVRDARGDLPVGTAMLVLHYLAWARDVEPEDHWVTLKEVPGGGDLFYPAFRREVLDGLVNTFGQHMSEFEKVCTDLGGVPLAKGEAGFRFQLLPRVPLGVALWSADDELPGSAAFLYDRTVHHFAPIETVISFGYFLTHRLLRHPLAPPSGRREDPVWE